MNGSEDDHRPLKRRKTDSEGLQDVIAAPTCQQFVLEEIDVELGLRHRLYETVQSRLAWALLLQETLEKEYRSCNGDNTDFQAAALDALRAAEEPSKPLFDREVFTVEHPPAVPPPSVEAFSEPRYPPRGASSRARDRGAVQPVRKLLFLRNTNTDPPEIAKLACPDCARSDFSNLQGLLNHCRIRHGREFGSHDECIESCAVIVQNEERDLVVASGTELGGVSLPSLRRLFELAVGGDSARIPVSEPAGGAAEAENVAVDGPEGDPGTTTELTRTLGYHKDTPALAPFLGREPKKRVINVYDDADEVLDILGHRAGPPNGLAARQGWRKHYSHRNAARVELDEAPPDSIEPPVHSHKDRPPIPTAAEPGASAAVGVASSRFHIVARVKVADSSLWTPPDRRRKDIPEHTHRWRLTVSSPSYSLHITTFLEKVTVTCLSDPPPSTLVNPVTATEPPFSVTSTTDRPFLARLTFTWTGGNANPPRELEHWVDVDPLHLGHPVLGDEQVFDVELDRNTQLLPVRADVRKLTWKDEDLRDNDRDSYRRKIDDESADGDELGIGSTLRTLLQQVPVTVRDARSRKQAAPATPTFALVPTQAQYRNLIPGRRKAIELSRARALLATYREHADIASTSSIRSLPPLTVGDVYHWMEEENLFPRDAIAPKDDDQLGSGKAVGAHQVPEAYCRFCGLRQSLHPGLKTEDDALQDMKPPSVGACMEFNAPPTGLPLLEVQRLLERRPGELVGTPYRLSQSLWRTVDRHATSRGSPSSADLAAIAHPRLLTAVRALAAEWHLTNLQLPIPPLQDTGLVSRAPASSPRQDLLDDLAPYAMLTAAASCMVRLLVRSALDALQRDEAAQRRFVKRSQGKTGVRRLLTPSHISRGLTDNAGHGLAESAALVCLAGFGVTTHGMERVVTGTGSVVHTESEVKVKEEEDA